MKILTRIASTCLIIAGFALTTSCYNQQTDLNNDFQQGKQSFVQQNYQQAFKKLYPVAKAGNPDAEYAVGYMYYYGKGVVENNQQAKYWLKKAAVKGQPLAVNALRQIKQREGSLQAPKQLMPASN